MMILKIRFFNQIVSLNADMRAISDRMTDEKNNLSICRIDNYS